MRNDDVETTLIACGVQPLLPDMAVHNNNVGFTAEDLGDYIRDTSVGTV
jgi:hypothetical protein